MWEEEAKELHEETPVRAAAEHVQQRDPVQEEEEAWEAEDGLISALDAFVLVNGLDRGAAVALREQPGHVVQAVMDKGPVTGRNKSATVISRIRWIRWMRRQPPYWRTSGPHLARHEGVA